MDLKEAIAFIMADRSARYCALCEEIKIPGAIGIWVPNKSGKEILKRRDGVSPEYTLYTTCQQCSTKINQSSRRERALLMEKIEVHLESMRNNARFIPTPGGGIHLIDDSRN